MKFSFEFARSAAAQLPAGVTGSRLVGHSVKPGDASQLRLGGHRPRHLRMYAAAVTDRFSEDFPVSLTSANAEIQTSAIAARSRARRLERDDPYAWGLINSYQNNVVGDDPFRLEMKVGKYDANNKFTEETETNRIIEEWWKDQALPENVTVGRDLSRLEMYLQAVASVVRDGGILFRKWTRFPNNETGFALEPIEVDRLDHNFNRAPDASGRGAVFFGIEMDEWGAPAVYHIFKRHPGDIFSYSGSKSEREAVPASQIIALWDIRTRAGQIIGMPRFVSIIKHLHSMRQYREAEMIAAIISADQPGFIYKELPNSPGVGQEEEDEDGEKFRTLSAGEIPELSKGQKYMAPDPKHPVEAYPAFMSEQCRAVAKGSGLAHSTISGDFSGMSFSSGRLERGPEKDEYKKIQRHIITNLVRIHFNESLKYAMLGRQLMLPMLRLEEFQKSARFHAKRWEYINPLQDAQADILRIESGLDSRQHVIAESERGGSFEEVCAEQASDNDVAEEHDLDFSGDATEPTVPKGEPGQSDPAGGEAPSPPPRKGGKQTIKKSKVNGFHRNGDLTPR